MSKRNLLDYTPSDLERLAREFGERPYRGRQLATWIFQNNVLTLPSMSNLPKEFRARLADECVIEPPRVDQIIPSSDGSRKFVLALQDGKRIHAVLMPDEDRLTLCLSTQVGCGFGCAFCFTGTMGVIRNLTAGEVVGQLAVVKQELPPDVRVTHIVFMGMGEPLANYSATVNALRIFTDPAGYGISPRRITVSTVGLVKGIDQLAKDNLHVNLAISLHATTDELRDRLMPINRGFPLKDLMEACRRFQLPVRRRIFFEYVMLDGVNDHPDDARRLPQLLRGIRAKVNLIPFNEWPGSQFHRPPFHRILSFQKILLDQGLTATIRWSKGEDIGAACGQLQEPGQKEAVPA
jgi:23S rRNA (adenine2503-C2)-methyltransferase